MTSSVSWKVKSRREARVASDRGFAHRHHADEIHIACGHILNSLSLAHLNPAPHRVPCALGYPLVRE